MTFFRSSVASLCPLLSLRPRTFSPIPTSLGNCRVRFSGAEGKHESKPTTPKRAWEGCDPEGSQHKLRETNTCNMTSNMSKNYPPSLFLSRPQQALSPPQQQQWSPACTTDGPTTRRRGLGRCEHRSSHMASVRHYIICCTHLPSAIPPRKIKPSFGNRRKGDFCKRVFFRLAR